MPPETEIDEAAQLIPLFCTHDFTANGFVWDLIGIGTGFRVFRQSLHVVLHGVIEEGDAVIENRSSPDDFPAVIIPQNAEIRAK